MKRNLCLLIGFAMVIVLAVGCNTTPAPTPKMTPTMTDLATPDREINPTMPSSTTASPTMTVIPTEDSVPDLPET